MSETDRTAIEIVRELQQSLRTTQANIRNTTIAMAGILLVAAFGAVFWGGGIDNQVDTNTKNINTLAELTRDFITDQKVNNENVATEDDVDGIKGMLHTTNENLKDIATWAKYKGYEGLPRSGKENEE